jgi:hypothetical protein
MMVATMQRIMAGLSKRGITYTDNLNRVLFINIYQSKAKSDGVAFVSQPSINEMSGVSLLDHPPQHLSHGATPQSATQLQWREEERRRVIAVMRCGRCKA